MKVKQFKYSSDNLGYLLYGQKEAAAIDGGAVDKIVKFIEDNGITLKYVLNTHTHYDHTSGDKELIKITGAEYLDNETLRTHKEFEIEGEPVKVHHTPGHMNDCLTFQTGNVLITGDTLFTGTVGNCFSGNLRGFFESIKFFLTFPGETVIYPGHDYVREALIYGKSIEPDNTDIEKFLEKYNPDHIFSTLDDELKINLFLRFNDERVISMLKKKNFPAETEYERWMALMNEY